jgi:hypothetical protein
MTRNIILLILSSILFISCGSENNNVSNANECFRYKNRENCFTLFFRSDGPFEQSPSKYRLDLMTIENHNIDELCNELFKPYKDKNIKFNVYNIAVLNEAPCLCEYIDLAIKNDDKYRSVYKRQIIRSGCSSSLK